MAAKTHFSPGELVFVRDATGTLHIAEVKNQLRNTVWLKLHGREYGVQVHQVQAVPKQSNPGGRHLSCGNLSLEKCRRLQKVYEELREGRGYSKGRAASIAWATVQKRRNPDVLSHMTFEQVRSAIDRGDKRIALAWLERVGGWGSSDPDVRALTKKAEKVAFRSSNRRRNPDVDKVVARGQRYISALENYAESVRDGRNTTAARKKMEKAKSEFRDSLGAGVPISVIAAGIGATIGSLTFGTIGALIGAVAGGFTPSLIEAVPDKGGEEYDEDASHGSYRGSMATTPRLSRLT